MQSRTALLTGGTGFVGGHVARALAEQGWKVRLLARDPGRAAGPLLEGLEPEIIPGSLEDEASLEAALAGVSAIVHVAGLTKARTFDQYREVNARGTERLVAAGRRSAPDAHFLLISSQAAAGPSREGRPVRDDDPARPISWYGRSKREGEEVLSSSWPGPWTVLRPSVVYGPGDTGLFQYFKMAASGWIPVPAGVFGARPKRLRARSGSRSCRKCEGNGHRVRLRRRSGGAVGIRHAYFCLGTSSDQVAGDSCDGSGFRAFGTCRI